VLGSTTTQEVSKSTEARYTIVAAAGRSNRSRAPGREVEYHRRIRRTIARKLLYRRAHGTREREREREVVPKNASYEFPRCISNGVVPSARCFSHPLRPIFFSSRSLERARRLVAEASRDIGGCPRGNRNFGTTAAGNS